MSWGVNVVLVIHVAGLALVCYEPLAGGSLER